VVSHAGSFTFNGAVLHVDHTAETKVPLNWSRTSFHTVNGRSPSFTASSLQLKMEGDQKSFAYLQKKPYVTYGSYQSPTGEDLSQPNGLVVYADGSADPFYHQLSSKLIVAAGRVSESAGILPIAEQFRHLSDSLVPPVFGRATPVADNKYEFAELSKPYTEYNWELGFHAPMQVADALLKSQQYDQAMAMMHHVFDPYAEGIDVSRVWKWYPFLHSPSERVLESILNGLNPRQHDERVTKWRDNPFSPFTVARGRIVAYMKWTVMAYIKILIAYGDMYFRRRTLEDIPLAIQLYVLASHLYGPKGETIPKRGKKTVQTYASLLDKWDAFSNAAVELEIAFPFSNQTRFPFFVDADATKEGEAQHVALANLFGFTTSRYFCLPNNPELARLRATIDQRLYNIRNCLDIDGRPLPLVLWEPPIDPAELIAAVASGMSISGVLSDLNASLPNYRFPWLLARALEVTAELKSLESTFLSIKEKRDAEGLQMLRTRQDIAMQQTMMEMKELHLEEANKTLNALITSQEGPKQRFDFFAKLAGVDASPLSRTGEPFKPVAIPIESPSDETDAHLNRMEMASESLSVEAQFFSDTAANLEVMASLFHVLPSFNAHLTPMGCGTEVAWGKTHNGT
jgi:hypothetical protein